MVEDKQCSRCKEVLTFDKFYKDKSKKFGVSSSCKSCKIKRSNVLETALKRNARRRERRKDPEYRERENYLRTKKREEDSEYRDSLNKKQREWSKNNPDYIKDQRTKRTVKRKEDLEYREREKKVDNSKRLANLELYIWRSARRRAKAKDIPFNIEVPDIVIPEYCPMLGIKLVSGLGKRVKGFRPNSPSLDKIDNTKGYVKGNIWVVSSRANGLKNNATLEELQLLVKNLELKIKSLKIKQ